MLNGYNPEDEEERKAVDALFADPEG